MADFNKLNSIGYNKNDSFMSKITPSYGNIGISAGPDSFNLSKGFSLDSNGISKFDCLSQGNKFANVSVCKDK